MDKKIQKIGIMGGTFDPIHMGHLILGETAYEQLGLDKVFFLPAGNPPHKQNRIGRATDVQRVEMVRRAIAGNPHFELSLAEMHADGFTYTYRTLEKLQQEHPTTRLYFILGADSLFDFDKWKEPQRISNACTIVAAVRNHLSPNKLEVRLAALHQQFGGSFIKLDTPNLDISSEFIRKRIHLGQTVRYYLPDTVLAYVKNQQIYGDSKNE